MSNAKQTPRRGEHARPSTSPNIPNARYGIVKSRRGGGSPPPASPEPSAAHGMFNAMYGVVKQIPRGKVASYGTVALLAGYPRCSRQAGFALHRNPDPDGIPCHRVVFKDGSLSPAFAFGGENMQRELLENEGVCFIGERVDMEKHGIAMF